MTEGHRLGRHEYHQRLEELASAFSGLHGRVEYGSRESESGATVKLLVTVHIPGWWSADQATMVFVEKHRWRGSTWERYAYLYDLHLEPRPSGRFAYHWHDDVFHVHCVDPRDPRADHHFAGSSVRDIFWAADELHRIFQRGVQCVGLVPLRDWVEAT